MQRRRGQQVATNEEIREHLEEGQPLPEGQPEDSPEVAEATAATDAALAALTEGQTEGQAATGELDPAGMPEGRIDGETSKSRNLALIPVPLDVLGESEDVPEDQWNDAVLTVPEERDEAQLRIDNEVKSVYDAWVTAGKPAASKSPRKRRAALPEHAPAIRHMLGRAGRLHGVRVVIAPAAHDKNGREVIVFSARDKEVRTRTPSAEVAKIREWAAKHDAGVPEGERFGLGDRGRIPEAVQQAYEAAMAEEASQETANANQASDVENQADTEE